MKRIMMKTITTILSMFAILAVSPAESYGVDNKYQDTEGSTPVDSIDDVANPLAYTHKPVTPVNAIAPQLPAGGKIGKGWVITDVIDAYRTVRDVPGGCGNTEILEDPDSEANGLPLDRLAKYVEKIGADFVIVKGARGQDVMDQFDWTLQKAFAGTSVRLLAYQRLTYVGNKTAADPKNPTDAELEAHGKAQAAATLDVARRANAILLLPTDMLYDIDYGDANEKLRREKLLNAYFKAIEDSALKPTLMFSEVAFDNAYDATPATQPEAAIRELAKRHAFVGDYLRSKCQVLSPRGFWKSGPDPDKIRARGMTGDFFEKHRAKTAGKDYVWMLQTSNGKYGGYSYIHDAVDEFNKAGYDKRYVTGLPVWILDRASCNDLSVFQKSSFPRPKPVWAPPAPSPSSVAPKKK